MDKVLTNQEFAELHKYRLRSDVRDSFDMADLLDEQNLKDFMEKVTRVIKAPSEKVAASIFIKRYAFLAVISLYAMTAWNKKIDISIENVKMEMPEQGKDWLPSFSLKDDTIQGWSAANRIEWRKTVLHDLFAKNIYLLIDQLEKTFHISRLILWENIAIYLFWLYETEINNKQNNHAAEDFRFLIFEAEGQLFGPYNQNPLTKYFSQKIYDPNREEEIRIRKTCCFNYQLQENSKRCKTCPCTRCTWDQGDHGDGSIGGNRKFCSNFNGL